MTEERTRLIRLLHEITEDEDGHYRVPMNWCAEAADAAIQAIMEQAVQATHTTPCAWCGGPNKISHTHKWDNLINRMGKLLPHKLPLVMSYSKQYVPNPKE